MKKQIATYFKNSNPSIGNVVASGYALGQEWYNTTTGEKFYHKTDGVWISVDTSALPTGTVTSVGLTMPSAFSVSNSPITSSGSIAVTGAGSASQYVRGDGTLASFPDVAGGGGGQVYYLNGGISQGVIGSASYYQMSVAANVSEGVDFTSGTSSGVFANFITDTGKPTQETIPAGVWILQCYFSQSESTGTPEVSASVEVYNGATFSVLSSSLVEEITNGTAIDLYTFTVAVPEYAPLTTSDRIAIRFSVGNLSGTNTVTLHTQGPHFSSVQTTFTTGLASLDGLTSAAQYFQTGTTGSDFNIATSGTDIHVFNLPTASSTKRGALSSTDWSTFNGKQDALGFTPSNSIISISTVSPLSGGGNLTANRTLSISQSSASVDGYLSSTDWSTFSGKQNALGFTPSNSTITISTTSPLSGGGDLTTNRTFGISQSSASASGYLSSTDWSTFNGKQNALTLTTTGTTGSATLVGSTLNIPQYPAATTATEMVRMFHSTWNFTTLSTWRTWTRGGSVMLTGDSNQTLGTGASPSSFADSNYILVTGRTRLKKVYWSMRHSDVASQGIELYIKSFTFANATGRGAETNNQVLVQQAWTGPGSSANGFKSDFTIATHSLDAITGIQIAFRQTSGTVASLQGVNLNLEFE